MDTVERKILDAAKKTFLNKGFQKANMADIAAEVGLTRPAMNYYFRTKERLFQAVFSEILSSFIPQIKNFVTSDLSLEDKISMIVDSYMNVFRESPELPYFIICEINRDMHNLINLATTNNVAEVAQSLLDALMKEMDEGRIRKMPVIYVAITFYGLMMTPFLARPFGTNIFNINTIDADFLKTWKDNVVNQMLVLLKCQ